MHLIEKNIHILSYRASIHTAQEGDFTYKKRTISPEIHTNTFHSILYLSPLSPYPLRGRLLVSHVNLVSVRACFQRPGSEGTIAANPEAISFHPDRLDLCITAALTFTFLIAPVSTAWQHITGTVLQQRGPSGSYQGSPHPASQHGQMVIRSWERVCEWVNTHTHT